jgi:hypothetical protein
MSEDFRLKTVSAVEIVGGDVAPNIKEVIFGGRSEPVGLHLPFCWPSRHLCELQDCREYVRGFEVGPLWPVANRRRFFCVRLLAIAPAVEAIAILRKQRRRAIRTAPQLLYDERIVQVGLEG